MTWLIYDWAGNLCFNGVSFDSFEDAWEFIYSKFEHLTDTELEEELGEYYVEPVATRDSRYIDPKDPRAGRKAAS